MDIRVLGIDDANDMFALEEELFEDYYSLESVKSELSLNTRLYFGAYDNDKLVGYIGAMIVEDNADIIKVGVKKANQRQGYATKIVNSLLNKLKEMGVKNVMLEVEHNNIPAINLYTKCGFIKLYNRENYYGQGHHAIIMKLEI